MEGITIVIKSPGAEPQVLEGIAGFSLVAIPETNPDQNTSYVGNLDPDALARAGMWQITLAKSIKDGTSPRAFGQEFSEEELRLMKMRRSGKTDSGIILPK